MRHTSLNINGQKIRIIFDMFVQFIRTNAKSFPIFALWAFTYIYEHTFDMYEKWSVPFVLSVVCCRQVKIP